MFSRTSIRAVGVFAAVSISVAVACAPPPPPRATPVSVPISTTTTTTVKPDGSTAYLSVMGPSAVTAKQMVDWFNFKTAWYTGEDGATVSLVELANLFLIEGRDEGVRGDIAFVQAMLETGWLRFSPRMPKENNNFSGIGAVDAGLTSAKFPSARVGVRAQIQHLRAYADATVTTSRLAHPLVDPRFDLVKPKGKATNWTDFGNGIWATDPGYSDKIKRLYDELLNFKS